MRTPCPDCDGREILSAERWRCDCGGAWEPVDPTGIESRDWGLSP